ncbi:GDSL esterase/lipase [Vitis vinifera]|uniref:GDSL esterase/lipase n=1 Tax=Vitis vinifera TaxID=29760 RepID=A0A438HQ90_VITVI|nr:GDSL esterase/lipase [Vitis vinifera]
MSPETPPQNLLCLSCFIYLLASFLLPCSCITTSSPTDRGDQIKGMFVFGSSLVDTGNNNFLQTTTRADFLPYGIDFPGGPSVDSPMARTLLTHWRPPSPSFHSSFFQSCNKGSCNSTWGRLCFWRLWHTRYHWLLFGSESLSSYLFVVGVGGNDITFNYFLHAINRNISLQAFTITMTTLLSAQLKKLHSLGGRKFALMSVNPLGYTPMAIQLPSKVYANRLNQAARLFNFRLKSLVDEMEAEMPGSQLVLVNTYQIINTIIKNPKAKGFKDTTSPCCEVKSSVSSSILCKRGGEACGNRSSYVFFDGLHPTEAVNAIIASRAYHSNDSDLVYPTNIKHLANL